jgi:hypothetical protein
MEFQSLPRYRGIRGSRKGWGEPDGHGKKPRMGLHDYVVLSVIFMLGFPMLLSLGFHLWTCRQRAEGMNSARERQMEQENSSSMF